ncbi:hypothetical protein [Streptomyces sp. NPDC059994]|uniref:hypothetical protein n=1 Tax=Streptomyces sp. NPDC059994 TaxID=3347029 RepID=UPI0036CBF8B2
MVSLPNSLGRRSGAVVALAASAMLAGAVPAHAEGSRTSYISAWTMDHESNRWHDSHTDDAPTKVAFSGCSSDALDFHAPLNLYRVVSLAPDANYGTSVNYCNTSNWGDKVNPGDFYFAYKGGYTISVNTVKISW